MIFHYAYLNTQEENDQEALRFFNKLIHEFPRSRSTPQAKYYLAQAQLRLRLTNDAINNLQSLRIEYPKTQFGVASNYYLGEYAYNKNNYEQALQYWRQYLKLSPDGRFANEIAGFISSNKNIKLQSDDYTLLGEVFFQKKDYKNAAYFYRIGNNKKKYYQLGYSLLRIGANNEAFNYLKGFAYNYPKSKNAKWSLFYASRCLPFFLRKDFWGKTKKEIPTLTYYAAYKEALLEENTRKKEKILKDLITSYPNNEFTLDAVWEIVWEKIKDQDYSEAETIGKKYFDLFKDPPFSRTDTRAKIGFWLGKISEIRKEQTKAIEYYKQTQDILFDNYYSFRARNRLLALNEGKDLSWNLQSNSKSFNELTWSIPTIISSEIIKKHFGATVAELISLQEYDEAIDLIGKSKFPSKQITAWLKALNKEYESSINLATSITSCYHLPHTNLLWRLSYPLYYWQNIFTSCQLYPELDPLLICSIIRQESRFDTNAHSISNAFGLMQLIQPTANTISRQIKINISSSGSLNDPQKNIILGITYFKGLTEELRYPLFAVASYNAGPHRVKTWINNLNKNDLDFFVEEIPYDETKNYIKKVFSNYWTYISLYKKN